jgi:transcription antitermination factor NusG
VAHSRPRCEKKIVEQCQRDEIDATLPLYRVAHKYRGKTVEFQKPLFPGYVFLNCIPDLRRKIYQSDYVANLLDVPDQQEFKTQLSEILMALETNLEIRLAPTIGEGTKVKIKYGPLRGVEGYVEKRHGPSVVLLRLDFIGQAAAVKVEATDLELI